MKAEPSLSSMKEQELKKTVMPFAQMRMKETNLLGPDVRFAPFFLLNSLLVCLDNLCMPSHLFIISITYHVSFTTYHACLGKFCMPSHLLITWHVSTYHGLTPDEQAMHKFTLQWSSHIQ